PNYATAYHWYGEFLAMQGKFDESFAIYKKALELEPYSLAISTDLGIAFFEARQLERSIEHFKKIEEMDPSYVRTHFYLARVYEEKGMFPEALDELEKGSMLGGQAAEVVAKDKAVLLKAYRASGSKGYWQQLFKILNQAEHPPKMYLVMVTARLGMREETFKLLDELAEIHELGRLSLKVAPEWDSLRDDPRF